MPDININISIITSIIMPAVAHAGCGRCLVDERYRTDIQARHFVRYLSGSKGQAHHHLVLLVVGGVENGLGHLRAVLRQGERPQHLQRAGGGVTYVILEQQECDMRPAVGELVCRFDSLLVGFWWVRIG